MEEQEDLQNILEGVEEVDAGDAAEGEGTPEENERDRRIACEECLHTIATYALELIAGKRQSIGADDIRFAFASHDLEEVFDEAKIFFAATSEDSDLDANDEGEEDDAGHEDGEYEDGEDEDGDEDEG